MPVSKAETELPDSLDEISPIVVDVVLSNKTETVRIDEPEIIVIHETKAQTSGKLAPLFVKKQKPDPAVLEARRLFLQSVPAENGNQKTERRAPIAGAPFLPFPTISHVTQVFDVSREASPLPCKFPKREESLLAPSFNPSEFKSVISLENGSEKKSQDRPEMTKGSLDEVLGEIESRCSDAREIWKRISTTIRSGEKRKSPKRKGKKRKSNEKKVDDEEKVDDDGIWTEKYRPMSSRDIVGNEDAAKKLHAWLNGWKSPLRGDDYSSGDEFYSSDCSYATESNQVAVLLGPHGSGKTASVYAVANELGYRFVLKPFICSRGMFSSVSLTLIIISNAHLYIFSISMSIKWYEKLCSHDFLVTIQDVD